jgi:hypothetical protein
VHDKTGKAERVGGIKCTIKDGIVGSKAAEKEKRTATELTEKTYAATDCTVTRIMNRDQDN